jgi:hypothetical protein
MNDVFRVSVVSSGVDDRSARNPEQVPQIANFNVWRRRSLTLPAEAIPPNLHALR